MTFETKIDGLVQTLLHNRARVTTLDSLWYALGCPYAAPSGWRKETPVEPPQPDPSHEAIIVKTLVYALHLEQPLLTSEPPNNNISLLGGLLRQDRWQSCLHSHTTAIELAASLTAFWESRPKTSTVETLLRKISVQVCAVLNEWLKPVTPFSGDPLGGPATTYDIARAMFGDAWCAIALSGLSDDQHWQISEIIQSQRPPFLPGLLSADLETEYALLPVLEVS